MQERLKILLCLFTALAQKHKVVFVEVNYRRGVLGFLSLRSLSRRNYPATSGNYGMGDVVTALKWIGLNIQVGVFCSLVNTRTASMIFLFSFLSTLAGTPSR